MMLDKRKVRQHEFELNIPSVYSQDGTLSNVLDGFYERPQQINMARSVRNALQNGDNLIVEAGTGTGKSLAYLIPATQFALETEAPIVVSTFTINLQEQLETSDLPVTQDSLEREFDFALIKGRNNYLCPKRLRKAWEERHLRFADNRKEKQLEQLMEWAAETDDGSRSDLNFEVHGDVWNQVCSKRGICKCQNETNTDCFYAKHWNKVTDADVLLVNHHLLLQDLALRVDSGFGLLPHYAGVILDEAHHLEHVARQTFGLEISYLQFTYLRRDLFHPEKETGLLTVIGAEELSEKVSRLEHETETFFNKVRSFQEEQSDDLEKSTRVYEEGILHNNVNPVLSDLVQSLRSKHQNSDLEDETQDELKTMINRITELKQGVEFFLNQKNEDDVYWIERSDYRNNVTLRSSPVDVSSIMKDNFFDPVYSVIMTSATLSTSDENPFQYFRNRVGLDQPETMLLGNPFDYRHQVKLRMLTDMTSPSTNSEQYTREIAQWLNRNFKNSEGQTFVLFTSYKMLNTVADQVRETLKDQGITLLTQGGDLPRRQMLKTFQENQPAVIFGADAFWEGVDIPGDNLTHVIITRLPFPNPADPLVEATSERLEKEGKNPFMEYYIPEAVLSLKQGFGRLIRSQEDSGEISILDSRILKKSYGHHFLNALPECKTVYESIEDVDNHNDF